MQKRRVIYMTDEEWAKLQEESRRREGSISSTIRALIVEDRDRREAYSAKHSGAITIVDPVIDPVHWDTAVDTSAMKPVGPAFNSRGSRPVPKGK